MKKVTVLPLVMLISMSFNAFASECDASIDASSAMLFSTKEIAISKKCKDFSITLKNTGTMAKNVMGHNLVISKSADMKAVVDDGMAAGLDKNYVKENDARVIAHTNVIGGGESTTLKVKVDKLKAGDDYAFFCTFPGHAMMMKGVVKVI